MEDQECFGRRGFARKSPVRRALNFEVKSLKGRYFFRNAAPVEKYLHIGCGQNVLPGFTNVDFYTNRSRRKVFGHDLRYPLPFADGQFEGAFSEHTLEHFDRTQAFALLKEIARVLRPGAVFRCVVPDLETYVRFYNGADVPGFEEFGSGCEAIWNLTQNHGHLSVWDAPWLTRTLEAAGFSAAQKWEFGIGQEPALVRDHESHKFESLYVEARK